MSLSLPADPPSARSLTDVVPQALAALAGRSEWFPRARSAIVFVVDGLGAHNLAARRGHARFLGRAGGRKDVARTVFPSTTAAALTSLLTATSPGMHGIVGYSIRNPVSGEVVNQLKGWGDGGLDPLTWQRVEPLLTRAAGEGRPCFVVSKDAYRNTGFTAATMRGAEFVGIADVVERARAAAALAARHAGALVYLYANDLDAVGHSHGWESDAWSARLERVDAAAAALAGGLDATTGAVVTADHGMVDVPAHRHVLLRAGDPLCEGVAAIGGEPRMLHLYARDGAAHPVADAWRAAEASQSWVLTRAEAIEAGLFGAVDPAVTPRIGDVVVAARAGIAYYDDRVADKASQRMIGQHGSWTDQERVVPLIRLGAFAR
jgi:hypothetical protein